MEDYKSKYESVLGQAKQLYESGSYDKETIEYIFPELAESGDEKIRQFLIHEVTETSDEIMSYRNMNKKDVLAWLEKQGQQKPTDIQSIEKRAHEVFPDDDDENTPLYRQAFIDGAVDYIDCGCKNTAWSEEDEKRLTKVLVTLNDAYAPKELLDWVESLKDKVQPQPKQEMLTQGLSLMHSIKIY